MTSREELREEARRTPRTWGPPDWLRRVLTLDELEEINEVTPTCWVSMFLWWRAGEDYSWEVGRACVRDARETGSCYCGRFTDAEEAREAMLRWTEEGKRPWQRGQHEGPDPCLGCFDANRTGDYFCDDCRPEGMEENPMDREKLCLLVPQYGDDVKYHLERPDDARTTLCGRDAADWSATGEQLEDVPMLNRTYGLFCVTCLDKSRDDYE